jgi:hypothetical protein
MKRRGRWWRRGVQVAELEGTFRVLKALLEQYAPSMHASHDTPTFYMLEGDPVPNLSRAMRFGGVELRKSVVTFHLLPVYTHPELLSGISDELRRRMQTKSSFDFVRPERELLLELSGIVDRSFDLYRSLGWIA